MRLLALFLSLVALAPAAGAVGTCVATVCANAEADGSRVHVTQSSGLLFTGNFLSVYYQTGSHAVVYASGSAVLAGFILVANHNQGPGGAAFACVTKVGCAGLPLP